MHEGVLRHEILNERVMATAGIRTSRSKRAWVGVQGSVVCVSQVKYRGHSLPRCSLKRKGQEKTGPKHLGLSHGRAGTQILD